MPRKSSVNDQDLFDSIKELYGSEITSGDLKGFCASRGLNYQTVTRRLEQFKTNRGRWNLEGLRSVLKKLSVPLVLLLLSLLWNKTLFLIKMIPSSSLLTLTIL